MYKILERVLMVYNCDFLPSFARDVDVDRTHLSYRKAWSLSGP